MSREHVPPQDRAQQDWDNQHRAHRHICEQWKGWEVPAQLCRTAKVFPGHTTRWKPQGLLNLVVSTCSRNP